MGKEDLKTDIAVIKSKLENIEKMLLKFDEKFYRSDIRIELVEKDMIGIKNEMGIKTIVIMLVTSVITGLNFIFRK